MHPLGASPLVGEPIIAHAPGVSRVEKTASRQTVVMSMMRGISGMGLLMTRSCSLGLAQTPPQLPTSPRVCKRRSGNVSVSLIGITNPLACVPERDHDQPSDPFPVMGHRTGGLSTCGALMRSRPSCLPRLSCQRLLGVAGPCGLVCSGHWRLAFCSVELPRQQPHHGSHAFRPWRSSTPPGA